MCPYTHVALTGVVHSNSTVQVDLFVVLGVGGSGGVVVVACCDCSTVGLALLLVLTYVHVVVMTGCNLHGWSFPNCRGLTSYSKDSTPCLPCVALFLQPIGTHSRI